MSADAQRELSVIHEKLHEYVCGPPDATTADLVDILIAAHQELVRESKMEGTN